ncbi:MAG TPA: hypothetical protein PK257_00710 [Candidatus Woesebacteria bacterium]|mgnify:CR=1 FL=1|nr:hypothetical protein [Candidatus Woesebacteria bacterium]
MSSLTYTADMSRKLIKYGGSGLIAFVLLWSIGSLSIKAYKAAHPKYIPPTVRYGTLPKMVFPEKKFEKKNFTFEFANDKTPTFSDQSKIYIIYRSKTKILALEDGVKIAKQFGFESDPIEINEGIYEFKDTKTNKMLTINVLENDFKLKYPYLDDQSILEAKTIPNKNRAIEIASSFLQSGNKYTDDLKNGEKKITYWKISDGTLKAVSAQSEANAVRVDFYRNNLEEKWEIVSPQIGEASVSVLISGSDSSEKQIIEANFKYADIDRESFSTYPIKTVEQAMTDLKAGNYWPSSDVNSENVIIREIKLAYYEPVTLTQYVQPIYIFKGDNNFIAFVPAVLDKYITK